MSVDCVDIQSQLVVQLYGISWLCSNLVSVGCVDIWCQLVVQLYGVSWLCTNLGSAVV